MVTAEEKDAIKQTLAALRSRDASFVMRPSQLKMIGAVAAALAGEQVLVAELPTGCGKSIGGALPGIVMARSRARRLVISSSTIALQQQLTKKDLPQLAAAIPGGFTFTLAKGRSRYACNVKLHERAAKATQTDLGIGGSSAASDPASLDLLVTMAAKLGDGEWDGDRDTWPVRIDDEVWASLTTDRLGCAGSRCPQFSQCGFHRARATVKSADVVVVNHDLLIAALTMPPGAVLPDPAETFYVIDECHNLPAVAVEHFARRHTMKGASEWLAKVPDSVEAAVHGLGLDARFHADAQRLADDLAANLLDLFGAIDRTGALEEKATRRFRHGVLPGWARTIGENIHTASSALLGTLSDVRKLILEKAGMEPRLAPKLMSELGFFMTRLESVVQTWDVMLEADPEDGPPAARWVERHENRSGETDFAACASPITASSMLEQHLWQRAAGCVLTSATITSCGSFSLFLRETGLDSGDSPVLLKLDSPFDYQAQAELIVPRMRSDPRQPAEHTAEIVEVLPDLVATGGSLVLFSSAMQMRDTFARVPQSLRADVLMQGAMPKHAILDAHRERIGQGRRSVIFGLVASFGEGVDLAGDLCTHVVLARLAFKRPDTPLEEARHEWIQAQGRSPFLELCVPEVGIRLAQSVGRLIRTHTDSGRVTVLDRRLAASRWGRQLIKGLPPFRVRLFPPPDAPRGLNANGPRVP